MELEGVGAVAVGGLLLQVFREVDDHDGIKRALLHEARCAVSTPHSRGLCRHCCLLPVVAYDVLGPSHAMHLGMQAELG